MCADAHPRTTARLNAMPVLAEPQVPTGRGGGVERGGALGSGTLACGDFLLRRCRSFTLRLGW